MKNIFRRKKNTSKKDYGHVFVLAGSAGFTGAAYLTAQAALLSGSGLVTLGIPESLNVILAKKLTEVMTKPLPETKAQALSVKAFLEIKKFCKKMNALAIGPGLSKNKETQNLVRKIVRTIKLPMVIDADALNALTEHLNILLATSAVGGSAFGGGNWESGTVLTPHEGEMARLIGESTKYIQANRKKVAKAFAKKYNVVLVLKGSRTIVANSQGSIYINRTGNPGMATGGTGDVLTGIIASFIGQGLSLYEAAKLGVYVHGLAGDIVAKEKGQLSLTATDLLKALPEVLKKKVPRPA
ncbi:MAG: NAD(P)H-hydrate dehydratase [Candidatus Omnitrophica bacterium]|nr:NAD(P)H-hydrate dehydratase [Candidatus Omnitrophota bacterium]